MPTNTTTYLNATRASLIVESLFFVVLSLIILAGNSLVCTAIYKNRKLRTKTNYYLVSLAVADIMVGLASVPYWVYFRLGKTQQILFIFFSVETHVTKFDTVLKRFSLPSTL